MHEYRVKTQWIGNKGTGTSDYRAYSRDHDISGAGKQAVIPGSSDRMFRGDPSRYNPEELLVSALSGCHMLAMLHLCADNSVVVLDYVDEASGSMQLNADGSGQFTSAVLRPHLTVQPGPNNDKIDELHHKAHTLCFIARSMNFDVRVEPQITVAS